MKLIKGTDINLGKPKDIFPDLVNNIKEEFYTRLNRKNRRTSAVIEEGTGLKMGSPKVKGKNASMSLSVSNPLKIELKRRASSKPVRAGAGKSGDIGAITEHTTSVSADQHEHTQRRSSNQEEVHNISAISNQMSIDASQSDDSWEVRNHSDDRWRYMGKQTTTSTAGLTDTNTNTAATTTSSTSLLKTNLAQHISAGTLQVESP
jgi:hypothetical protein